VKELENNGVTWCEAELPGARAAFSTRIGGVSEGAFASLNLGVATDDVRERVHENRLRLATALGRDPTGVLTSYQAHGPELLRRETAPSPSAYAEAIAAPDEGDAQATSNPALTPLVLVADCLPVALAGPDGVAMAHAGWRGLAAGVLERSVAEVKATAAAIGPGIGQDAYEVGEEVLAAFAAHEGVVAEGRNIDLAAIAEQKLRAAGVEQIERAGLCTSSNPELFFSHRRDGGVTGRQAGLVWIEG
jgi:polyphenol oxidase